MDLATAIALAMSGSGEARVNAMAYCQQAKEAPDAWRNFLPLFTTATNNTELRFFALQALEEAIRHRYPLLEHQDRAALKEALWSYLATGTAKGDPSFIRSKFALLLFLVFQHEFPNVWPSFFADFTRLVQSSMASCSGDEDNVIVDIFIKFCRIVDEEVVCRLFSRDSEETARNTRIKDIMRENGISLLVQTWLLICSPAQKHSTAIVESCLKVIGMYISWTEISLYLNDLIPLLYQYCLKPDLRMAACECLGEVLSKGMKSEDKYRLVIQPWRLVELIQSLQLDDEEFKEQVARLLNVFGSELLEILDAPMTQDNPQELQLQSATKREALKTLHDVFPRIITLLADVYDDTSCQLFSFLADYIQMARKWKKDANPEYLTLMNHNASLFRVIMMKMKYEDDAGADENDEEDETEFLDLRKCLKQHFLTFLAMDRQSLEPILFQWLETTMAKFQASNSPAAASPVVYPNNISWTELELFLHLIYIYGESVKVQNLFSDALESRTAPETTQKQLLTQILTQLAVLDFSSISHNLVHLLYFELINRYAPFFERQSQLIPYILMAFVGKRGLHNPSNHVRCRVYYLFSRFVKTLRGRLDAFVNDILIGIQDLLVVPRPTTSKKKEASVDDDDEALHSDSFDSQLYLFEAVGILVSSESFPRQVECLQTVMTPIMTDMQSLFEQMKQLASSPLNVNPDTMEISVIYLSRMITCLGELAKGFPDYNEALRHAASTPAASQTEAKLNTFKQILGAIIVVLQDLNQHQAIREASRFTFQRMVGCMGPELLSLVNTLLQVGILPQGSIKETIDFLNFFGLIVHKFKDNMLDMLSSTLLPLLEKVFYILNQTPTGTDHAVQLLDMRKGYFNFLNAVFHAQLERVFLCEANAPQMPTILQSVLHYTQDETDSYAQRLAFSVLNKLIVAFGGVNPENLGNPTLSAFIMKFAAAKPPNKKESAQELINASSVLRSKQPVPGFDQYIYTVIVPLLFSMLPSHNVQTHVMIADVFKTLYFSQGKRLLEFIAGYLSAPHASTVNPQLMLPPWPNELIAAFGNALMAFNLKDVSKALKMSV